MSFPKPIHPFPARMAPSIALQEVQTLPTGSVVLDPMMGYGTVMRVAAGRGHSAVGRDVDPLAVLMTRVWTTPINTGELLDDAKNVIRAAQQLNDEQIILPWMDDPETRTFIDYWFGQPQQDALRRLSFLLHSLTSATGNALQVALSKIIITKNQGASLARDVSHSRPHRVCEHNTYSVYEGFLQAVRQLARRLAQEAPPGTADIALGDARCLTIGDSSVNAVITSPPYLNAIDYLRGHRLALVWLGYRLTELRAIRSGSIGVERAPAAHEQQALITHIIEHMQLDGELPRRQQRMIERYILDLHAMLSEIRRVLRPDGRAVFVLGDSCIKGVFVRNSSALAALAQRLGFHQIHRQERLLPPARRYLPPPAATDDIGLGRRMRAEIVLTYIRQ